MAQVDPWEKAADCERAIRITLDPLRRETLTNIREFWIALAQKSRFLNDDALAIQIETTPRRRVGEMSMPSIFPLLRRASPQTPNGWPARTTPSCPENFTGD
jgi:hypothetical protein